MTRRPDAGDRRATKILYVEDNAENRMLVRAILEDEGYTLVEAEDGLAGIEAALREQPALILLDINLPGVDGYEVGVILKSFPDLATVPIIAVTAYAMDGDRQRTLVAGCDGYIAKPIDADRFPRQVAEFLRGKRERVEEAEAAPFLRELNQRLVYRLVNQVDELRRLNAHFVRRAVQLEDLHAAVRDITSEMGVVALLERLLPSVGRALATTSLSVDLSDPEVHVTAQGEGIQRPRGVLGSQESADWAEVEWTLPIEVRGNRLGTMTARHVIPAGAKSDEEQLLKIVANQVGIAVENARLYEGMAQRAAEEESLVEAGRLLTGTLELSEVLQTLAGMVRARLAVDMVRIWLLDEGGTLQRHAVVGDVRHAVPGDMSFRAGEGTVGWVLDHRKTLMIADLQADPRIKYPEYVREEGLVSFLGVPLLLEDEAVGVMVVSARVRREFSARDVALAEALAASAAAAIRNARLYAETQQRLRETETLLTVSQAAGSVLDVAEIARRTVRGMVRALGADIGGAWRRSPDGQFIPVAGYHVPKDLQATFASTPLDTDVLFVSAGKDPWEPVCVSDSQNDAHFNDSFLRLLPHRSMLGVPMVVKGELVGGFAVIWTREAHHFASRELRLVEGMAGQAAIAIENARLLEAERAALEQLTVSETRYRELFENVIDILYLHDLEGRILEINDAGVRATGFSREEILEMNIFDFFGASDRERATQLIQRMVTGGRTAESFVAELLTKDGRGLFLEMVGRVVLKNGAPMAVLVSARDITVRRRLERRQESLVALSRELATEVDVDRLLPRIAEEARRLMGMDSAILLLLEGNALVVRGAAQVDPALAAGGLAADGKLLAAVIRERRPLVYANLGAEPGWGGAPIVRRFGYRAMLAVPLTIQEKVLGILQILHREPRPFPYEEIEFLRALATQAALAIDNARLFAAQREEAEISAGLLRLAEATEGVRSLDEVLDTVVRSTPDLLDVTQCLLFLQEPADDTLIPRAASGLTEADVASFLALTGVNTIPGVQRALRTQDAVMVETGPDLATVPSLAERLGVRALLVIPLVSGGRVMGALGVPTPGERYAFTPKQIALARGIAAHAAVAIEKARLLQETRDRLRETETLLTISQALSSTLDQTETMRRVAREIARTLGADMVGAYLADADRQVLRPIAGYHVPRELYQRFLDHPIPIAGHPAMEQTWRERRAFWTNESAGDARVDPETMGRFPHQSLLFVPMTVKGEPIGGFFVVWWKERRQFTTDEIRLVEGISDQAAMFIENARLYSEATRRRREAEELARLARMLTESLDAADVGDRIVESALELLGGAFSVLRLQHVDGSLKLIAAKGEANVTGLLPAVVPANWGMLGRAVKEGTAVWSNSVPDDPRVEYSPEMRERLSDVGTRSFVAVPLRVKREVIGALGVGFGEARSFVESDVALLQTFADQAAIALENSRLYGDLRAALRTVEESQQRIVQGERLRALGEMAGGVAHDFNNVLAIIVGRAEVLISETQNPELQRQLEVIIKVALDAAQTVKRIQEFTRMRRARPFQQINLTQLLEEVVEVTRSRWKDEAHSKGIKYDVEVQAEPTPTIAGDPSEIREALTNIVFNALDAMPEGGELTLGSSRGKDHVVCTVRDTGIGMSEDVRQRIFDPFFTTKGERGTGLGLSVVYGIITRHGGEIEVQSQPGQGCTFIIRLPLGGPVAPEAPPKPVPAVTRKGRVLVIDDEADVGAVVKDVLSRDGHEVVVCTDGESGLNLVRTESFDLVITDLGMPGVSGWEVARAVKRGWPRTPVVMVTGWGDRIDPAEAQSRGVDYIVSKPFKRDTIRELVASALS